VCPANAVSGNSYFSAFKNSRPSVECLIMCNPQSVPALALALSGTACSNSADDIVLYASLAAKTRFTVKGPSLVKWSRLRAMPLCSLRGAVCSVARSEGCFGVRRDPIGSFDESTASIDKFHTAGISGHTTRQYRVVLKPSSDSANLWATL
jgi:hypothetical protein